MPARRREQQPTAEPTAQPADQRAEDPAEQPDQRRPVIGYRQALLILGSASWLGPFSIDAYSPALPAIADGYGVGDGLVQLTLSATLVGMALGPLVTMRTGDRHGRRGPLLVALAVYALASAACALAPTLWSLVAARLVQGVSASVILVTARAVGRDLFSGSLLTRFYIQLAALVAVAPLVGPLAGAQVVRFASWRWIFAGIAVATVLLLLVVLLRLPETAPRRQPDQPRPLLLAGLDGRFGWLAAALGLTVGVGLSYVATSPFVLQEEYGFSPQQYSLLFSGNAVVLLACSQVNTRLARRWSAERLLPVHLTVQVVTTLVVAVVALAGAPAWLLIVTLYGVIAAHGLSVPTITAAAMHRGGSAAGRASSVLGIAQFAPGAVLAPALTLLGLPASAALAVALPTLAVLALGSVLVAARWRNQPTTDLTHDRNTTQV